MNLPIELSNVDFIMEKKVDVHSGENPWAFAKFRLLQYSSSKTSDFLLAT